MRCTVVKLDFNLIFEHEFRNLRSVAMKRSQITKIQFLIDKKKC